MAKNRVYEHGDEFPIAVPSGVVSGDPVVLGQLPGVAEIDRGADGTATCQFNGVYLLSVKGIDGGGNAAIAAGDRVYFTLADTPRLNKKNTGVPFGIALAPVASGATTAVPVKVGA